MVGEILKPADVCRSPPANYFSRRRDQHFVVDDISCQMGNYFNGNWPIFKVACSEPETLELFITSCRVSSGFAYIQSSRRDRQPIEVLPVVIMTPAGVEVN